MPQQWVSVKELLKILKEKDLWSIDTKYLHIYLDTRYMNGDYRCTIRDRENKQYLTLEDLKQKRHKLGE